MPNKNKERPAQTVPGDTPYTGLLAELPPVLPPDHPPLWVGRLEVALDEIAGVEVDGLHERWNEFVSTAREQLKARHAQCLSLLCQHYSIDMVAPDAGWKLAMALAAEHVPAFQMNRSLQKQTERRAKKPIKLDVYGTACLFLSGYLEGIREERPLSPIEERYAEVWANEVKERRLALRTVRELRHQMLGAHLAYWKGCATDFQRQFVEQVDPLLVDLFEKLAANRVARSA